MIARAFAARAAPRGGLSRVRVATNERKAPRLRCRRGAAADHGEKYCRASTNRMLRRFASANRPLGRAFRKGRQFVRDPRGEPAKLDPRQAHQFGYRQYAAFFPIVPAAPIAAFREAR